MLTPDEQTAWDAYVAEMAAKGLEVDLIELMNVLISLQGSPARRIIADALGVGRVPLYDLAVRLTLQTRQIVQTGRVPE